VSTRHATPEAAAAAAETPPRAGLGPPLAFVTCCVIWGSTFLAIRMGNDTLPPLWAAALRLGLASVLLVALTYLTGHALPRGAALRAAAQFGFLNFGISFCLLYWAETTVPSGLTAVVYATIPLTTGIAAHALGMERLRPRRALASLGAIAGVAVIFMDQLRASVPLLPLLAVLTAATCAALSGVALKRGPRQHPLGANAIGSLVGFPICLAASLVAREPHVLPRTALALGPLVYLTVVGSLGAFVLYAYLVNRWPVSRTSFIAVVVPVVALTLGILVRGERVTGSALAGSGVVLVAVALGLIPERGAVDGH
jgi:drug/metabolite transporter (DMT)-like permease